MSVTAGAESRRSRTMAEETDGVGETFDDSLRVALTIASQFGERISRLREQTARQREADAVQEARELSTRFEAERGAARASLAPVEQAEWWNQASPQNIADVHETATAWRDFDDRARNAADRIKSEVQTRYGIDADAPGADADAVAAALAQAERDRADAASERSKAGKELTASQMLLAQIDRHEREAQEWAAKDWNTGDFDGADIADASEFSRRDADWRQAGESLDSPAARTAADLDRVGAAENDQGAQQYDSSERRERFASSLESKGIAQATIAARILADGENAKHPREAIASTTGKAAKVRNKSKSAVPQRARGGLSR
ncbi:hypothetical protein [Cryobacterium sp. GrIS_2_6]|uniref:hypothetical protein n=1 Tax=Cryobacterium sp. GrIS_2_6 TaxID=3162785 RepID=UPI002E0BFC21|nr:colicin import membrane protein [Cryobacterium psychrotolerans]